MKLRNLLVQAFYYGVLEFFGRAVFEKYFKNEMYTLFLL